MNPEHISGTTARSHHPIPIRRRAEDNDGFTAARMEAVSFALARLNDPAVSLYGRVKVAGDKADSGPLERTLFIQVMNDYGSEWIPRWRGPGLKPKTHKKDTIRNIVRMMLFEELYGPICPKCCGGRWVFVDFKQLVCHRCKGRGISPWSIYDRSRIVGMEYVNFIKVWWPRAQRIRGYFQEYESEICRVRI